MLFFAPVCQVQSNFGCDLHVGYSCFRRLTLIGTRFYRGAAQRPILAAQATWNDNEPGRGGLLLYLYLSDARYEVGVSGIG